MCICLCLLHTSKKNCNSQSVMRYVNYLPSRNYHLGINLSRVSSYEVRPSENAVDGEPWLCSVFTSRAYFLSSLWLRQAEYFCVNGMIHLPMVPSDTTEEQSNTIWTFHVSLCVSYILKADAKPSDAPGKSSNICSPHGHPDKNSHGLLCWSCCLAALEIKQFLQIQKLFCSELCLNIGGFLFVWPERSKGKLE